MKRLFRLAITWQRGTGKETGNENESEDRKMAPVRLHRWIQDLEAHDVEDQRRRLSLMTR